MSAIVKAHAPRSLLRLCPGTSSCSIAMRHSHARLRNDCMSLLCRFPVLLVAYESCKSLNEQ